METTAPAPGEILITIAATNMVSQISKSIVIPSKKCVRHVTCKGRIITQYLERKAKIVQNK